MKKVSRRIVSTLIDLGYMAMALGPAKRSSSAWYKHFLDSYYAKQSHRYDEEVIEKDKARYGAPLKLGLKKIQINPSKILDLSTGTGYVAFILKRQFPLSKVIGTDLSEAMLQRARSKAMAGKMEIEFRQADGAHLPFLENEFDLVAVQNAPFSASEALRVLRPGGHLLIAYTSGALVPHFWRKQLLAEIEKAASVQPQTEKIGDGFCILLRK